MRFAVCMEEGERRLGVVRGDRVATLGSPSPDLLEVIGWGRDGLEAISKQADVLPAPGGRFPQFGWRCPSNLPGKSSASA